LHPILICGIYVDLNPIRAGEAIAPEQAVYTSAYDRIEGRRMRLSATQASGTTDQLGDSSARDPVELSAASGAVMPPDGWLCELTLASGPNVDVRPGTPSATPWRVSDKGILSIGLDDYLKLLDWTGRKIVAGKRGAIPSDLAPILERLHINGDSWLDAVESFDRWFGHIVASTGGIAQKAARIGRRWLHGAAAAAKAFT